MRWIWTFVIVSLCGLLLVLGSQGKSESTAPKSQDHGKHTAFAAEEIRQAAAVGLHNQETSSASESQEQEKDKAGKESKPSKMDFETDVHGWLVMPGADGKVDRITNATDVKNGKGALRYTYVAAPNKLNVIVHLEPEYYSQGFRFWIKTDRPTAMLFSVSEEEGGERWETVFWTKHNEWQQVTIALSDMTLAEDSPVKNNKIEMDKSSGMGFLDALAILGATDEATVLFGYQQGTHTFWLDDFEFLEKAPVRTKNPDIIEDFQKDYLSWFALNNVHISKSANGMKVKYSQNDIGLFGVGRSIARKSLASTKGVSVRLSVKNPTKLAFGVEEQDGERWMLVKDLGAEKQMTTVNCLWSELTITDDTKGKGDGKLDPASIKMFSILDLGVLMGEAEPANEWEIAEIKMVR